MSRAIFTGFSVLIVAACTSLPTPTVSAGPDSTKPQTSSPVSATPVPTPIGSDVTGHYEIVLGRPDGSFPLPVTVVDHTGLIVGIAAFPPAEQQPTPKDSDSHGIVSTAGREQGFVYAWEGSCAPDAVIDIRPGRAGGLTLVAVTTPSTQGCLLVQVFRFMLIKTSEPIPLEAIELR